MYNNWVAFFNTHPFLTIIVHVFTRDFSYTHVLIQSSVWNSSDLGGFTLQMQITANTAFTANENILSISKNKIDVGLVTAPWKSKQLMG